MIRHILITLAVALSAAPVLAQNQNHQPLITVSGQAEVMVVPDEAVVKMSDVTLDENLLERRPEMTRR